MQSSGIWVSGPPLVRGPVAPVSLGHATRQAQARALTGWLGSSPPARLSRMAQGQPGPTATPEEAASVKSPLRHIPHRRSSDLWGAHIVIPIVQKKPQTPSHSCLTSKPGTQRCGQKASLKPKLPTTEPARPASPSQPVGHFTLE